jgi:hypothetical protein
MQLSEVQTPRILPLQRLLAPRLTSEHPQTWLSLNRTRRVFTKLSIDSRLCGIKRDLLELWSCQGY